MGISVRERGCVIVNECACACVQSYASGVFLLSQSVLLLLSSSSSLLVVVVVVVVVFTAVGIFKRYLIDSIAGPILATLHMNRRGGTRRVQLCTTSVLIVDPASERKLPKGGVVLRGVVVRSVVLHGAVLCGVVRCCAVLCGAAWCLHGVCMAFAWYGMVWAPMVPMVWYSTDVGRMEEKARVGCERRGVARWFAGASLLTGRIERARSSDGRSWRDHGSSM